MNKITKASAMLAVAGASFLATPELASAETGQVGPYTTVEQFNLGLDGSGLPSISGAPNNGDLNDPLRFHQGGKVEVASTCDPATGIGSNVMKLTTVSRPGDSGTVTWGVEQQNGKEFYRQALTGGRTAIIPNLPSGVFNLAWFEEDDIEGAGQSSSVYNTVLKLEGLVNNGGVTENVKDDMRKYPASVVIPECVLVTPETTTTTTTSTTVPETTTTTLAPTTTVPETTSTVPEVRLIPPKIVTRELANTGKNTAPIAILGASALIAGLGIQTRKLRAELKNGYQIYKNRK